MGPEYSFQPIFPQTVSGCAKFFLQPLHSGGNLKRLKHEASALSIRRFANGVQQMVHIPAHTQLIERVVHLAEDFRKVFTALRTVFKAPAGIFQLYYRSRQKAGLCPQAATKIPAPCAPWRPTPARG